MSRPARRAGEAGEAEAASAPARRSASDRRTVPDADDLRRSAAGAVRRGRDSAVRARRPLPRAARPLPDPELALRQALGDDDGSRASKRMRDAARAFEAERFADAQRSLAPVVADAPGVAEVRELMGLALYRLEKWADAVEELEVFRDLSGSTDQHPVLADCHRALGNWADVDALWIELGEVSPSAELVVEGRIVVAGSLADRGDLEAAIRMLEQSWKTPKRPRPHHLRRAYALADLYDQSGRTPRARELFRWIETHAPDLADVRDRVRALS